MCKKERLLVILATYNEIDNLPRLVHQLTELLPDSDLLVVDDASPDGTGNWCEQAKDKFPQLVVKHREGKLGLGSATALGFQYALENDYGLIATMDADLSHDPVSLVKMVERIQQQPPTEVVIGSRYVEGGGTEGWPLFRRFTSRFLNLFARVLLGLKTKDNSGAFRVYKSEALKKIELSKLKSSDFAYLEEILWRLKKQNVTMVEIPITFKNRELGRSKTSPILGLRVFWQIVKMSLGIWK